MTNTKLKDAIKMTQTPMTSSPENAYDLSAPARAFLAKPAKMLIDGEFVDAKSGKTFTVFDPACGREFIRVPEAGPEDVDLAVKAARRAFESPAWADMIPVERERLLWRLSDLIEEHADELAELEALDNGKVCGIARVADVPLARDFCRYMAGWATKIEGHTINVSMPLAPGGKFHSYVSREPVGVVGQIIPWNFPLLMAIWKIAPVLATGCTTVLKPAEQTPVTALRLAELVCEAGYPEGVVNVVTGMGHVAGAALVEHEEVDKIAFTGSTEVGKIIGKSAMQTMKRLSLELGGKSPVVIFADADLDAAIKGAADAIFFNHGQVCTAGSRLYVERTVFDRVSQGVADIANAITLGAGLAPGTQMGPLVSAEQQDRVCGYIASGLSEGASALSGGGAADGDGYFVKPTVLTAVNQNMKVVREEIFGPVLVAQPFDNMDEAVALANDTDYGLGASVWSTNLSTVHRVVPKIKAGTVWVNAHNLLDSALPFGGYKQSGMGREMGRSVLDLYTESKSVCMMV